MWGVRNEVDVPLFLGIRVYKFVKHIITLLSFGPMEFHEPSVSRSPISCGSQYLQPYPLKAIHSFPKGVEELITSNFDARELGIWKLQRCEQTADHNDKHRIS